MAGVGPPIKETTYCDSGDNAQTTDKGQMHTVTWHLVCRIIFHASTAVHAPRDVSDVSTNKIVCDWRRSTEVKSENNLHQQVDQTQPQKHDVVEGGFRKYFALS